MDKRPIGVFDSGVGGLTAVKELRKILPGENIIYFGDTGRVPYGNRSAQTIKKYATQAIRYLASFNVKAILAACGTVSSNFSQEEFSQLGIDIPYITVVAPSAKKGIQLTKNKNIGVLATSATVESGAFQTYIDANCPDCTITAQGCPLLVMLVENGITDKDHPVTSAVLDMYLEPIIKAKVDTLVLGCTHFPILNDAISDKLGSGVALVDSGAQSAAQVKLELEKRGNLASSNNLSTAEYYVTDTVDKFIDTAKNFLVEDINNCVKHVDIDIIDI